MTRLTAEALSLHLNSRRPTLDQISLTTGPGELVGLIGPNGAGKSSLLRCLAGLRRPDSGRVLLDGRLLTDVPDAERARRLGYLAQGGDIHWPLPVEEVVALGRLPHASPWSRPSTADRAAIEQAMAWTEVDDLRHRPATALSGGEKARVLLARALAATPDLLLADEPGAGLDPYHSLHLMELLRERAAAGLGVLLVLHDLTLAARFCTRLVLLDQGRVVEDGPAARVLHSDLLERVYGVRLLAVPPDLPDLYLPWSRANRCPLL